VTVVVVAGGDPPSPRVRPLLPAGALVVAADSGVDHAHALGLVVDVAVGDFDSVSAAGLAAARAAGARIEGHPAAKDATDLELSLAAARALGAERVLVVGGGAGRLDHLLANALVLAAPDFADLEIEALLGAARVTVIRGRRALLGSPGALLTLLPVHGPARGISTEGLRYPLADEHLPEGSTRGVSNLFVDHRATVTVTAGTLLAVQPDAL
jgi:thiamine pyrophosphokinase